MVELAVRLASRVEYINFNRNFTVAMTGLCFALARHRPTLTKTIAAIAKNYTPSCAIKCCLIYRSFIQPRSD